MGLNHPFHVTNNYMTQKKGGKVQEQCEINFDQKNNAKLGFLSKRGN